MALIGLVSVYEEDAIVGRAIESMGRGGVDAVFVFDGAWASFDPDNLSRASRDRTRDVVLSLGAEWLETPTGGYSCQEEKRTRMFRDARWGEGDHALVFDADEELEGIFPALDPGQHYNMLVRCVGPNDLPGIRGVWPHGDYAPYYKPEIRVFAYDSELRCRTAGRYLDSAGWIVPYADPEGSPALPVVTTATFLHHGNDHTPERNVLKLAYYEHEHDRRQEMAHEWSSMGGRV